MWLEYAVYVLLNIYKKSKKAQLQNSSSNYNKSFFNIMYFPMKSS